MKEKLPKQPIEKQLESLLAHKDLLGAEEYRRILDETKLREVRLELASIIEQRPPFSPVLEFNPTPEEKPKFEPKKAEGIHVELPAPKVSEMPSFGEHILFLKERQKSLEKMGRTTEFAEIKIDSDQPIGIVLSSDWHIGSQETDYETFERHMNLIKKDPYLFLTALSNTIDGYIWPGGIWSEVAHIEEQVEIARAFAKEWKGKLLAVVGSRCHDWTKDRGGISPQETAFLENTDEGMPFFTNGGVLTINLNDIKYSIAMLHKSKFHSSLNVTNPNKRVLDLRFPGVDVVAIAHQHVRSVEHTQRGEGKFAKEVLFVRTGTYKINDSYSKDEGWGEGHIGGVMVILDPSEKKITPFLNLTDGADYLKALRELRRLKGAR